MPRSSWALILDVGCGYSSSHVKKGNIGVDLKKGLCDVVGSVYYLPFKGRVFPKAVMSHILEHLLNLEQALKEVKRVLKPKAILEIEVPNPCCFWSFRDYVFSRKPKLGGTGWAKEHICAFGEAELQNLMRETGFQPMKLEYVESNDKRVQNYSLSRKIFYRVLFRFFPAFRTTLKLTASLRLINEQVK